MNSYLGLIRRAVLTAAVVLVWAPAGAQAGSLLSGYGGPGQGSQALLGSSLIGGSGGGSSSGGSGGAGGSVGSLAAPPTPARHAAGSHGSGTGSHARRGVAPATGAPSSVYGRPAALRFHESGAGSSTLGLSTLDFVYILAVLGGLVLVALLTRNLARGTRPGAPD